MRIAVTGSSGQVAVSLLERASDHAATVFPLARPRLDLTDSSTIMPVLESVHPDIIVNAAAYTAVDKAEKEEDLAYCINSAGAGAIAHAAELLEIPIIHLSTDYVFSGALDRPYREDDATGPINAYGRSKLSGEKAVQEATQDHVILRTSWLYSPFGTNFMRTMLRLGDTRDRISVVADQIGQPTSALDIADGILAVCRKLKARRPPEKQLFGIFHMAASGATSWAEFAEAIFAESAHYGRRQAVVVPVTTDQYPRTARRPANSRLETRKLEEVYGVTLPSWQNSLPIVAARLLKLS